MSDVSKTNEREKIELAIGEVLSNVSNFPEAAHARLWGQNIAPLREKLVEAVTAALATPVPVQGEPNNDREVLKRIAEEASVQRLKDSIEEWRKAIGAAYGTFPDDWELEFWHAGYKHGANAMIEHQLSRATVPDAATEPKNLSIMNGWLVEMVGKHTCGTGPDGHYGIHEPGCGYEPHLDLAVLEGWPGAERDAALAAIERVRALASRAQTFGADEFGAFKRELLAALDGAPEPEVKP